MVKNNVKKRNRNENNNISYSMMNQKKKKISNDGEKSKTIVKGTRIGVVQRDGSIKQATVVDKRVINQQNDKINVTNNHNNRERRTRRHSLTPEDALCEFYVHYKNEDKRLDEWISSKQISVMSIPTNEEGQQNTFKPRRRLISNGKANGRSSSSYLNSRNGSKMNKRRRNEMITSDNKYNKSSSQNNSNENDTSSYSPYSLDTEVKEKNIKSIRIGHYLIDTWYYSPVPGFQDSVVNKLYFDEMTMRYFKTKSAFQIAKKEGRLSPPGHEVYRDLDQGISLFEVDGAVDKIFCQGLCLLSKMFLDHKTIYFDTAPFKFYVLCEHEIVTREVQENDSNTSSSSSSSVTTRRKAKQGIQEVLLHHPVGYYSKEKESAEDYNLACICTFPPYQRKGYGKLLISFSYAYSVYEKTPGTPEKPLSDLGWLSYESFWRWWLLNALEKLVEEKSIPLIEGKLIKVRVKELVKITGMLACDIIETSSRLGLVTEGIEIEGPVESKKDDSKDVTTATAAARSTSTTTTTTTTSNENENEKEEDDEDEEDDDDTKTKYIGFTPFNIARLLRKHVENKSINICKTELLKFRLYYNDNRFFQRIRSPA